MLQNQKNEKIKIAPSHPSRILHYSEQETYLSLRKSLSKGVVVHTYPTPLRVIKEFACECKKHHGLRIFSVVSEETDSIQIKKCKIASIKKDAISEAVTKEGHYTLHGYDFFIHHSDWKVRAAVAAGLGRINSEKSLGLLSYLLSDTHFGVRLAALQAVESFGTYPAFQLLSQFLGRDRHTKNMIQRAVERMKFGINKVVNPVGETLNIRQKIKRGVGKTDPPKKIIGQLRAKGALRKLFDNRTHQPKLLLPKNVFHSTRNLSFYYQISGLVASPIERTIVIVEGQKFCFESQRRSKDKTAQRKIQFIERLLVSKSIIIARRIDKSINPRPGEVYWAVTPHDDPKPTRPVLIVDEKTVMPLTSQVLSKEKGIVVTVSGETSKVQISRQEFLDTSLLLCKHGILKKKDLRKILAQSSDDIFPNWHVKERSQNYYKRGRKPQLCRDIRIEIDDIASLPEHILPCLSHMEVKQEGAIQEEDEETQRFQSVITGLFSEFKGEPLPKHSAGITKVKDKKAKKEMDYKKTKKKKTGEKKPEKKKVKKNNSKVKIENITIPKTQSHQIFSDSTVTSEWPSFATSLFCAAAISQSYQSSQCVTRMEEEPTDPNPLTSGSSSGGNTAIFAGSLMSLLSAVPSVAVSSVQSMSLSVNTEIVATTTFAIESKSQPVVRVEPAQPHSISENPTVVYLDTVSDVGSQSVQTVVAVPVAAANQPQSLSHVTQKADKLHEQDAKRPANAKTVLCRFFQQKRICHKGKDCTYAHGESELVNRFVYIKKM
jgi:hypothetical protein